MHAARRVPGGAGGELGALHQDDVLPAVLDEVVEDAATDHSSADDSHSGMRFHASGLRLTGVGGRRCAHVQFRPDSVECGNGTKCWTTNDDLERQPARRRRPAVGEHHGDGEDRRPARRRLRPARADRRRQARARPLRVLVRAGRLHGHRGRDGEHVRAAAGRNPDLPPVAAGSHLDTQPHGGKFDGSSACWPRWKRCAPSTTPGSRPKPRSRSSTGPTRRARARPAMIASGVFAGVRSGLRLWRREPRGPRRSATSSRASATREASPCGEHPLGRAVRGAHRAGSDPGGRRRSHRRGERRPGPARYDIEVRGRDSHAGTTPMPARKDALVAAARMAAAIRGHRAGQG